jgi:hypothetical protein
MRYFLNVKLGDRAIPDQSGAEFSDIYTAIAEAELAAREIAADELKGGHCIAIGQIEITDAFGRVHDTVSFQNLMASAPPSCQRSREYALVRDSVVNHMRRTKILLDETRCLQETAQASLGEIRSQLAGLAR